MTYLEGIKIRVTMAVMLKDELSPDERTTGEVFIKVSGIRKKPVRHSTGYFFLLDAPQKFKVVADGAYYKEEFFDIDIDDYQPVLITGSKPENPKIKVAEIKLKRK